MTINRRYFLKTGAMALPALSIVSPGFGQDQLMGRWKKLADLPYPVQEIYPALLNNKIYVAGGFAMVPGQVRGVTDRHVVYDINANQWDSAAVLPEARHHPNLVACNNNIYALGGFKAEGSNAWVMQDQTWVYRSENNQWLAAKPAPALHGETVCLNLNNKIHVIGGRAPRGENNAAWADHIDTKRHWLYDPQDDSWHLLAPSLHARNSAAGATINSQLFVVGGRTVGGGNVDYLEVYDPQEDSWRQAAPMPQGQGGLAAAALGNQLVVFGGEYFGADGSGVYKECWRYNPAADRWDAVAPMLTPRHGLGGVSDGQFIYAVAGATQAGGNGTSAVLESFQI